MNEELNSFVVSLLEDTQFKMDEYHTPEMAFTAVALDKIVELLDCTDPIIEHWHNDNAHKAPTAT